MKAEFTSFENFYYEMKVKNKIYTKND